MAKLNWIGLDEGYIPFLRRRPSLVFEPAASAVFMAHYFWRITNPSYAKGRTMNFFDVRVADQFPKRVQRAVGLHRWKIDHGRDVVGCDLNEFEFRDEAVFADLTVAPFHRRLQPRDAGFRRFQVRMNLQR